MKPHIKDTLNDLLLDIFDKCSNDGKGDIIVLMGNLMKNKNPKVVLAALSTMISLLKGFGIQPM